MRLKRATIFSPLLSLAFLITSAGTVAAQQDFPSARFISGPTRSIVSAPNGIVATSQPLAVQVGLEILKRGGNAIDAAVAANAMIGLSEPQSCGIGGDLFVIYWDNATQKLYGLNASGRSPYEISMEKVRQAGFEILPTHHPYSWSVPGCVDGWAMLLERFGTMSLKELLEPSIRYAEQGVPLRGWVHPDTTYTRHAEFRERFMRDGQPYANGDMFRNPALAATYRLIAEGGRDAFYKGEIARRIVEFSRRKGGLFSMKDFADHRGEWVEPVSTNYRGYDVWELPPNGQGIATLQILNILEGYDIASLGHNSADYIHLFVEAKKLAFADRARFYTDMDFHEVPVKGLISDEYAAERRKLIDPRKASVDDPYGEPPRHGDTIYMTVADKDHNMISFIQSVYWGFGSGYIPGDLGFALQNRGALFAMEDDHPNRLEPHKRPFHTIIPSFVTRDGKPWLSFGVMGGDMQPQGQVQVLVNIIDFGMDIQQAGDAPRVRHSGSSQPTGARMVKGGLLAAELGIDPAVVRELQSRGHNIHPAGYLNFFGGYQAIMLDEESGMYHGASDPRRAGCAFGY
ncbi:MAG: gamma-glutamyltransferase [Candidatus Glassbacteria bacterium]|nr:gamma-glutamyltransferase [Candidatus Glassbacteria bacterium]